MVRGVTKGERTLLEKIFKNMLPYDDLCIGKNTVNFGGKGNSVTPNGVVYMSTLLYVEDFSTAPMSSQWTFVHEHAHVWQWVHGKLVWARATGLFFTKLFQYDDAYPYQIDAKSSFNDFNIEQQASIVADYFYSENGLAPKLNTGSVVDSSAYRGVLTNFWSAGPPRYAVIPPGRVTSGVYAI